MFNLMRTNEALKRNILLLDIVLILAATKSTQTIHAVAFTLTLTIKLWMDTIVHWQPPLGDQPCKLLDALIQPTSSPSGDICGICRNDPELPHRISCNHVFCRKCARQTLSEAELCPICRQIPTRLHAIDLSTARGASTETYGDISKTWLSNMAYRSIGLCLFPSDSLQNYSDELDSSRVLMAVTRASIHQAITPMIRSILDATSWGHARQSQIDKYARAISAVIIAFATISDPLEAAGIAMFIMVVCQFAVWLGR